MHSDFRGGHSLSSAGRSVSATLFLLAFLTYAYFYAGAGHNEAARFDTIRAVIVEGRLIVDTFAYNSADLILFNGHHYSSKAPGTAILGLPFFWFFEKILSFTSLPVPIRDHWVVHLTSVFTVSLAAALMVVVLFWLGVRWGATRRDSAVVALTIGLGTLFFPFATVFFGHSLAAAFLLVGFYQIFAFKQECGSGDVRLRRLMGAGLLLGFSIVIEFPAAIAVGLIYVYAASVLLREPRRWKALGVLVAAGGVGLLPLFAYNLIAFGSPFYLSYSAYTEEGAQAFEAHRRGLLGVYIPLLEPEAWGAFIGQLLEITIRPLRGLFVKNPVLLLAIPGLIFFGVRVIRDRREQLPEFLLVSALFVSYLGFNAGYGDSIVYWGGGHSFGPRHVIPMVPFLFLALLEIQVRPSGRWLLAPLALLSIFICFVATAIEVRTPYAPGNPLLEYYLPSFLAGEFAINPSGVFSNEFTTANSVAFNPGKLMGLPGSLQLAPLLFVWLILLARLDLQLGIRRFGLTASGTLLAGLILLLPMLT
jgi:hypothetical protein